MRLKTRDAGPIRALGANAREPAFKSCFESAGLFVDWSPSADMNHVRIDDIESTPSPSAVRRPLADALGATDLAVNYFELEPGDSFAYGYHAHHDQEEVFYVQSGTATFETEDGDRRVAAGEAVRFAPGEFQQGRNDGDERVVALALGAPKETDETEVYRECPACDDRTPARFERADDGALLTVCADCDTETGRFA